MVIFPEDPTDGQQVFDQAPDGSSVTVWTYNAANNEWTYKTYDAHSKDLVYTNQVDRDWET